MAVDTALKRFSAIHVGQPWRGVAQVPDGTIGQRDRQAAVFLYSGILATSPATTAAITGTVTASITEAAIVTGGETIILTLANDTWVAAGAAFNAQRQAIINGLTAGTSQALGWNNVVKALQGVAGVVRTSATAVTITLDAQLTYNITAGETITATVQASALVTSLVAVVATPTFSISAVTTVITDTAQGIGNWYKKPPKRKPKRIRLADYATPEERAIALAQALAEQAIPVSEVLASGHVDDDEIEDDEILLLAALRVILH